MADYDKQALADLFAKCRDGDETARFVRAVWLAFYLEDGRVVPNKGVSGGDLVELIGELFARMKLVPDDAGVFVDG